MKSQNSKEQKSDFSYKETLKRLFLNSKKEVNFFFSLSVNWFHLDEKSSKRYKIINDVNNKKIKKNDSSIALFLIINIKPINKFKKDFIKSFGLPSSR